MFDPEMEVYTEMKDLEMDASNGENSGPLPTPPATPATPISPVCNPPTAVLIEGLNPPPSQQTTFFPATATSNRQLRPHRRQHSNIVNHPNRQPAHMPRRCLMHLVPRCPLCCRNLNRNTRFFRQEGIRAILALIRDVFGVGLNPRELSLFSAGYYSN